MDEIAIVNISRRRLLQSGAGLALAVYLGPVWSERAAAAAAEFAPNAFLRIGTDGVVTVIANHLEMGQGTYTGLATLVAEELDADWARVRVEGAPADVKRYGNPAWGGAMQGTGGSSAIAGAWQQLRQAGASARAMLVAAAAQQWKVPAGEITVSEGVVSHAASKHQASFGELAEAAAQQPVPAKVELKSPDRYTLIGRNKLRRKDSADKTDGSAIYTQDIQLPDMLVAVIAHPPRFDASVKNFDATKAKATPGVVDVVQVPGQPGAYGGGVAVLAKDTWSALQGRQALTVEWDESKASTVDSDAVAAEYRALLKKPGLVAVDNGDVEKVFANAARVVEAEYSVPYAAHASMEPLNCVVKLGNGTCEVWNGEQFQTPDQMAIAKLLGIAPERVTLHQLYAGGSFGRRANPKADYLMEAVTLARAARAQGHNGPVKLVWSREDDTRGGYYRPLTVHGVRAALDKEGKVVGWWQRIVGQSVQKGGPFGAFIQNGIDRTSVEGVDDLPYAVGSLRAELHSPELAVPVQWWRSVGHTHTGFAVEAFVDEVAAAAKQDPYQFRRALLAKHPRELGVLDLAAQRAGWGTPLPTEEGVRRGRGIAVHKSFNTYVAQVAEVSVRADGSFKVERVVCAVDCGVAVNPDVVRAQMEGGIGYGLSAVLHGPLTLKNGAVQQSNFHDYPPLRINEMPAVEVHIVPSRENPTGVGEPATAVIAPALVNALYAATGQRVRDLPVDNALLKA